MLQKAILIQTLLESNDIVNDIIPKIKKMFFDVNYKLVIDINDETILTDLFHIVDETTKFSHVLFDNEPYYEWTNRWTHCPVSIRPDYDEDIVCNSRNNCEARPIFYPDCNDVEYVLTRIFNFIFHPKYKNNDMTKEVLKLNFNEVLLVGFDMITFQNVYGVIYSHEGSNHCKINLIQYPFVQHNNYLTLFDLAMVYYKIKSYKWDKTCERLHTIKSRNINGNLNVGVLFRNF